MSEQSQQTTLGDYLRILRRSRLLILVVTLAGALIGLGYSLLQDKTYEATAQLSVRDTSQDLGLIGGAGGFSGQTALQNATAHMPEVTRLAVVRAVQEDLDVSGEPEQIRDLVSVEVDPNAYTLLVKGQGDTGSEAARIANAFAHADARISAQDARETFARKATRLEERLRESAADTDNATAAALSFNRLQTLQSLSATAQPIQVSAEAQVPSSAASPATTTNTIAGGAIGLLLGLGIAYGRSMLDRRLRAADDAEAIFGDPVLVRLRPEVFGHTGSQADATHDVGPLEPTDSEAIRMLRENVRYLAVDRELRAIAVTSAIPEEGKSTTAACLAMAYASAGKRTLLVEADLRRRVLAGRLEIAEAPGLSDYLAGRADPGEILQSIPAPTPGANGGEPPMLTCITAGSAPPRPADLLSSARFADFVSKVGKVYDHVVIDCPPLLPVADTLEILPHADAVLMCVRLNRTTTDQAQAAKDALERLPHRPTGLVITDFSERRDRLYYYRDYYAYRGDAPAPETSAATTPPPGVWTPGPAAPTARPHSAAPGDPRNQS